MIKNRNLILSVMVSLALMLSGCSTTADYYADVENEELSDQELGNETAVSIKYTDFLNSNTVSGVANDVTNPYYKSVLSEAAQDSLEEIIIGMLDYKEYVTLTRSITEDELAQVMNVILTNVPEVFHVDFSYQYDLNVSGYVRNLYPIYTMDYSTFSSLSESLERSLISDCTDKTVTEYTFLSSVYKDAYNASSNTAVTSVEETSNKSYTYKGYVSQTLAGDLIGEGFTSLGAAKYIQYYCNYMGITNAIVIGECIDSDYDIDSIYPSIKYKVKEKDNIYTVTMDLNNYHAWNIVNIGGQWVNCDAWYDKFMQVKDGSTYGSFFCVPDEIVRQTRLFYINNKMLGLTPSCSENSFGYNAREMYYIQSYSDEEIQDCVDAIIETIDYNVLSSINIQFETESNYRTFCELFDTRMELFNQTHNNDIPKYSVTQRDYCLVAAISDIVFSNE